MSDSYNNKWTMKTFRNFDLWKPGPCSKWAHTAANKRLDRRIKRKRNGAIIREELKLG